MIYYWLNQPHTDICEICKKEYDKKCHWQPCHLTRLNKRKKDGQRVWISHK